MDPEMVLWGCCNTSIWQGDPEMVLWGVVTLLFGMGGSKKWCCGGDVTLIFGRGRESSIYFYL